MKDPASSLQRFLVGGAVRDKLLGEPAGDRDWVVIGATEGAMKQLGFKSVGKEFPVFLHPVTGEEYALARRERKVASGYKGFAVDADSSVSLTEDLRRRDLTINAMAEDINGQLFDPFGGLEDLKKGNLRHVSPAFVEDPVRVLRIARFATRFNERGFTIVIDTEKLIREMVHNGEVDALVPERIWRELVTALNEHQPSIFFQVLRHNEALARIFPEIDEMFDKSALHPGNDKKLDANKGERALSALDESALITNDARIRFAVLVHDLDGGTDTVKSLCSRLHLPSNYSTLALTLAKYHHLMNDPTKWSATTILTLLKSLSAFRNRDQFDSFLTGCHAIGYTIGKSRQVSHMTDLLIHCLTETTSLDFSELQTSGSEIKDKGAEADRRRLDAISTVYRSWKESLL
ncbi:MAG: multifunctional CCA tRNA nucleotidyl transferase/2'3'-cyclic phosphodiesterase/2'nucleotidase/phosphatase [Acidiferrobacteraceae bacterium]|nr:multifunctional CCA tRNA nucleotidyl transferase/2'3'-cyclic phosphodiesterase/2'nucleotidase/phosphatase [Acidiferrobacteraceae bacterium]